MLSLDLTLWLEPVLTSHRHHDPLVHSFSLNITLHYSQKAIHRNVGVYTPFITVVDLVYCHCPVRSHTTQMIIIYNGVVTKYFEDDIVIRYAYPYTLWCALT